jgi:GTP-binding protein Era
MTGFRSGIVAVVGRPNVGKSTLVNAFVGQKVAIVSNKPQTTRRAVRAILTSEDTQIVFTDTPGFHRPKTALGSRLNELVGGAVHGVDVVIHVVDAAGGIGTGDAFVYEQHVGPADAARLCAVNKVDGLRRSRIAQQLVAASELGDFDEIVPVSATRGDGVATLHALVTERLPHGPPLYPPGDVTDQPLEERIAELIREQALRVTRQEVPHSVAVVVDEMTSDHGLTKVYASVIVERESQKPILIGKGGDTMKRIGTRAREEMEQLLDTKVYLDLQVKVVKEWQRDPKALERLGF